MLSFEAIDNFCSNDAFSDMNTSENISFGKCLFFKHASIIFSDSIISDLNILLLNFSSPICSRDNLLSLIMFFTSIISVTCEPNFFLCSIALNMSELIGVINTKSLK